MTDYLMTLSVKALCDPFSGAESKMNIHLFVFIYVKQKMSYLNQSGIDSSLLSVRKTSDGISTVIRKANAATSIRQ